MLNIVKAHQDYPISGQPGQWKMTELVSCNFWWLRMAATWQIM